jgi:hypothetical protein
MGQYGATMSYILIRLPLVKTLSYEANPFKNLGKFDCLFDFYQKICYNIKKDFFTDRETGQPHPPRENRSES